MSRYLIVFSVFIVIAACQKEVEEELPSFSTDCRLVRMVQGTHDGLPDDTTFLFEYDADGRMSEVTWVSEGFGYPFQLAYDIRGKLIEVQNVLDPSYLETTFRYDPSGRLVEIKYERFDSMKHIFEYGADTLPLRCRTFYLNSGNWEEGYVDEYTFLNGDMVKSDNYMNGVLQRTEEFDYYETMPSILGNLPLISINSIPLGYYLPFQFFNRHMPKTMHLELDDYHWQYGMDSGRIVQAIGAYTHPSSSDTTQKDTRSYHYECK